jgi:hypothetical protein
MAVRNALGRVGWVSGLAGALLDALAMAPQGPAGRGGPELWVSPVDPNATR